MWTLLKAQCNIIANKKEFIFAFMIMMLCIAANHMHNVVTYYGSELSEMVAFPEISLLGCNNIASYYFFKLYPFLLVMPAGFSLAQDKTSSMQLLFIQRSGRRRYYTSKYLAVFIMTFLCFSVPLFFEIILNVISFPMDVHGNLFGYGLYTVNYKNICNYTMFDLYYSAPVLYAVIMCTYFGIVTAVFSTLPSAVSCIFHKYKAYLLLPVYIIIYLSDVFGIWGISSVTKNKVHFSMMFSWCDYVIHTEQFLRILMVSAVILIVSMSLYAYTARKDTL